MEDLRGMYVCEKCGSELFKGFVFLGKIKYVKNKTSEHLLKTCHICEYQWREKCFDHDTKIA